LTRRNLLGVSAWCADVIDLHSFSYFMVAKVAGGLRVP
jgi:hypothetical protein